MFAAGKTVWYLPLAVLLTAALLFAIVLGYDRYIFTHDQNPYPESLTTFLSTDTITALKQDARLHHAILGVTESVAQTSSEIGQWYGIASMEDFGVTMSDTIAELCKRNDVVSQKRGLLDDMNEAMKDLSGGLGVNGGLSSIVANLGTALTQGLATPALFLGIGVG